MSQMEPFPLEFWSRDRIIPLEVLAQMLTEMRQSTKIIIGLTELLLESDLSVQDQVNVKTILAKAMYQESILDAGREYYLKTKHTKGG